MPRCGTYYSYRCGCKCPACREANATVRRKVRNRKRGLPTDTRLSPGPKAEPVRFQHDLVNLHHAMTIEDWREREAADPGCRPVTASHSPSASAPICRSNHTGLSTGAAEPAATARPTPAATTAPATA